jgi:hypothetical protein
MPARSIGAIETTAEGTSACNRPRPAAPERGIESSRLDLSPRPGLVAAAVAAPAGTQPGGGGAARLGRRRPQPAHRPRGPRRAGRVDYLLGVERRASPGVTRPLRELLGTTVTAYEPKRAPAMAAGRLTMNSRHRPIRLDDPETTARTVLAALTRARTSELLVLQLLLGPRRVPLAVPTTSPSSVVAPWRTIALQGSGGPLDGEKRTALRSKVADHGFAASLRFGAAADDPARRRSLLLGAPAAVRTVEAPGLQLRLRPESARRLNRATPPWRWPLRLGVAELLPLTGWPFDETDLPGRPAAHPRRLAPPPGTTGTTRVERPHE